MICTNLYVVFKKIKNENPHPVLPDISENDYSRPEKKLNAIIEQGISKMAKEVQPDDTTYVTVFENGSYRLSKSESGNGYMKLLFYRGYKYLFFEHEGYTVLINYSREDGEICYRGNIHTWEYLPEKEELYRVIGKFYMVNTYNAFCGYVENYKGEFPSKTHNADFFRDAQEILLSCSRLFAESDGQVKYNGKRECPQMATAVREDTHGTLSFTYMVLDQLIIIADCSYSIKGMNVTAAKRE